MPIPPRTGKSLTTYTAAQWRRVWARRRCIICGVQITPSDLTANPANAARITLCSKACKQKHYRQTRTPEQKAAILSAGKQRAARWYANPANKVAHIAKVTRNKILAAVPD